MRKNPSYRQLCLNIISELRKMLHEMAYMKHHFGSGSKDVLGLMKTFAKPIKRFIRLLYKHRGHIGPFASKRVKQSIRVIIREAFRTNTSPLKHAHLKHKHWNDYAFFRLIKTFYIELEHTLNSLLQRLPINTKEKEKMHFSLKLFLSALNPANFFPLNPEILETTWHQKGKNILQGLELWLKDANDWHGYIHYHKNEYKTLQLGTDIATSQKQIVLKNEVMELLYFPCEKKCAHPIVIVPSWINKYYIFDLKKNKSIVRWLHQQGFDVYIISWVNPTKEATLTVSDYVNKGIMSSLDNVLSQHQSCHLIGYCLGGTLLSMSLSIYPRLQQIKSLSLMATVLDFENAKPLSFFFQKEQLLYYQDLIKNGELWDGRRFATAFNLLCPDDYIWFYWINRYGKGKKFPAIDALIWSADLTNATSDMYKFYMQDLYYENNLIHEKMQINQQFVKLKNINIPVLNVAFEQDHIAPIDACAKNEKILPRATNVLAKGGHFTGICQLPSSKNMTWWKQWLDWIEHHDKPIYQNAHQKNNSSVLAPTT